MIFPGPLTADEYRTLVKGRRLAERTIKVGYDLIVRGKSSAEVRDRHAISVTRLHGIRRQLAQIWQQKEQVQSDWALETIVAPRLLIERFLREVAAIQAPPEVERMRAEAARMNSQRVARARRSNS